MTAPTREQREEWRRQIGQPQPPAGLDPGDYDYPEIIQVLLDALDAAEERAEGAPCSAWCEPPQPAAWNCGESNSCPPRFRKTAGGGDS